MMALRDGWFITDSAEGGRLVFQLVNGSPYQVRIEPEDEAAMVLALEPGYYDEDLNEVPEDEAISPDEDGGEKP